MWGDYHLRELIVYVGRAAAGGRYLAFHAPDEHFDRMDVIDRAHATYRV